MNPSTPLWRATLAAALALAAGPGTATADWSLLENFESSFTVGSSITGINGWVQDLPTNGLAVNDPAASGRGVVARAQVGARNDIYKLLGPARQIANNTTGTLFFEAYLAPAGAGAANISAGLSDVLAPNDYAAMEAQFRWSNGDISPRNGLGFTDTGHDFASGSWMRVWLVVNNAADNVDMYVESPAGSTGKVKVADNFGFRNGLAANPMQTFMLIQSTGQDVYFDNIYVDNTGENLGLPLIAGTLPVAHDDSVEVGVGGAIGFNPLANDTGYIDPASLVIISGPAHGTAQFDAASGKLIYKHAGTAAGSDVFRYRITRQGGGHAAEADVHVGISASLRLANTTLSVPPGPPTTSAGTLTIKNGLPGVSFSGAVGMTSVPGVPAALLVASIDGSVWYVPDSTLPNPTKHKVLDVASLSNFTRGRSIYSIEAFPDFATTGHIIINYQGNASRLPQPGPGQTVFDVMPNLDRDGLPDPVIATDLRVSRFTLAPAHIADAVANGMAPAENLTALATEYPYLNIAEQHLFHSINDCKFGPDGYLYLTFGDEGDQGDPYRNGQRLTKDFYSSMLRIDLDPASTNPKPNPHYAIAAGGGLDGAGNYQFYLDSAQSPNFRVPADNPFIHTSLGGTWDGQFNGVDLSGELPDVRTEMWAVGLRNPFKFHLDVEDGTGETEAWIGDVGRDTWEEFTILKKGQNAGWSFYEGNALNPGVTHPSMPSGTTPHKPPLFTYLHSAGNNSATGGVFYRDTALAPLTNRYVCGDYGSGRIWSIGRDGNVVELTDLRLSSNLIVDFHIDPVTKDILVLENSGSGRVMRITLQAAQGEDYPATLSQLGIFADLTDLRPNPGVVPYEPNLKFWSDSADKSRWFAIKNLSDTIGYAAEGNWAFPEGMIWVKHFDFDLDRSHPGTVKKRLETRVLVRNNAGAYGVAYRWNAEGTEATLVANGGEDFPIDYLDPSGAPSNITWHIPSRAECNTCHTATAGHALSMNTRQFNLPNTIAGQSGNLISLLSNSGYLAGFSGDPAELPRHHRPDETGVDLETRVRSYLAVNCSYCHQPGGSAPDSWDARPQLTLAETHLLYGHPVSEATPDLTDHIIRPGDKANSAIWNKINARTAVNGSFNGYSQMPPLATNVFDPDAIAMIGEWIDHYANQPPAAAPGSVAATNLSENAGVGSILGLADAVDPDVREGTADQSLLTYEITAGNEDRLFSINPATGELLVNGIIDFERQAQHLLTIQVSDHFTPNPGVLNHGVIVDLIDETSPDATADADGNGIFDLWEAAFGLSPDDRDGDGSQDFFEFLSGGEPLIADDAEASLYQIAGDPAEHLFGWNVRNGFLLGEDYQVQSSPALDAWADLIPADYEVVSITPVAPGISRMVIKVAPGPGQQFMRLKGP
ncbi:cadherin domain-containing protein [Luteolibacter sp. Populi]|uniref:cadherin domain-containing protein n=1 Tax=Luteolibacter sp. Populi TaxID=3230487 RepID=UPI0034660C0B